MSGVPELYEFDHFTLLVTTLPMSDEAVQTSLQRLLTFFGFRHPEAVIQYTVHFLYI